MKESKNSWTAFSIDTFAKVLQNYLSLVQDCCEMFSILFRYFSPVWELFKNNLNTIGLVHIRKRLSVDSLYLTLKIVNS